MDTSVGEIANLVGGLVSGENTARITGLNGIRQAKPGDLTFVGDRRYMPFLETTEASAILVSPDVTPRDKTLIHVKNPYFAFVKVIQTCAVSAPAFHPTGLHETAVIGGHVRIGKNVAMDAHVRVADDCTIGDGVILYAGVYIGRGCSIGEKTILYPNVTLREGVQVGSRCIIHAGAVLGSDGFGFAPMEADQGSGTWFKIPQVGNVVIGDDVEIGANTSVDRATFGSTAIGRGTKIDNLVQIGHNVVIGEHCVISGMTGLAGSVTVGNHVTIAAQVGIADHVEIGDGATVAGRSGVTGTVKPGSVVVGYPAMEHSLGLRVLTGMRHIPELPRRMRELERRIQELENQLHGQTEDHRE